MTASLLRLLQLCSPALPVGAFSYSEGLEVLQQQGRLADGEAVESWITAELERGGIAIEAASLPLLRGDLEGWRRGDPEARRRAITRDGRLLALREAAAVRRQQRQMGQSLLQVMDSLGAPLPAPPASLAWPGAWAWAGLALDLPPEDTLLGYLHGWAANQLSAAVRLVPLGPLEAQRRLHRLEPVLQAAARRAAAADPERLWSGGVGAALAQLGHDELYSRLFRS
jgi:urease accessory protein